MHFRLHLPSSKFLFVIATGAQEITYFAASFSFVPHPVVGCLAHFEHVEDDQVLDKTQEESTRWSASVSQRRSRNQKEKVRLPWKDSLGNALGTRTRESSFHAFKCS